MDVDKRQRKQGEVIASKRFGWFCGDSVQSEKDLPLLPKYWSVL